MTQIVKCISNWLAHLLKANDKSSHSSTQDIRDIWDVRVSRLQFIPVDVVRALELAINTGDVSIAWDVWSGAEDAPCGACCVAGVPMPPDGILRTKRGWLYTRCVRCGRPKVRHTDGSVVHMHRDGVDAPVFKQRRRLNTVPDVIQCRRVKGFSLSRGLELSSQWGKILEVGSVGPSMSVTLLNSAVCGK